MYRVWDYVSTYSLPLIAGAILALVWANIAPDSYHAVIHTVVWDDAPIGTAYYEGGSVTRVLDLHYLVNDVFMAFFFAIAGKEVWEALILKDGSLRGRRAVTPLIATAGGMIGPVAVYLLVAAAVGQLGQLAHGWAVPTATDIAFSYLVGRLIFGARHPAIGFLLLSASCCFWPSPMMRRASSSWPSPIRRATCCRCGFYCRSPPPGRPTSSSTGCRATWTGATPSSAMRRWSAGG